MQIVAKILLTLVALETLVGAALADYNITHIFNPLWPPHAVFHGAQTILLSIALGLCTLYYCWFAKGDYKIRMSTAIVFASLYWITQSLSGLFPRAAFFDPNVHAEFVGPLPIQLVIDLTDFAVLTIVGFLVARTPGTSKSISASETSR